MCGKEASELVEGTEQSQRMDSDGHGQLKPKQATRQEEEEPPKTEQNKLVTIERETDRREAAAVER